MCEGGLGSWGGEGGGGVSDGAVWIFSQGSTGFVDSAGYTEFLSAYSVLLRRSLP